MENRILPRNLQRPSAEKADNERNFYLFLRNWYWFVISISVFVGLTFVYNTWFRSQGYSIDANILVTDDSRKLGLDDLFQKSLLNTGKDIAIGNEVALLRSYSLNYRVFDNLGWRTSWYQKRLLNWDGLYTREPFLVEEATDFANTEDVRIEITPLRGDSYSIAVDGMALVGNKPQKIEFSAFGRFGMPFKNQFFHFTIHQAASESLIAGEKFSFCFNNKHTLTRTYLKKLKIGQTEKKNEIIHLMTEGSEPLREIHFLNGLIEAYTNYKLEFRTLTNKRSLDFIDSQLSGISDSLNAAGNTVSQFRARNQVVDLSAEGGLVMAQLREIEREKSQSQMQLKYFQNLQNYLGHTDSIKKMVVPSVIGIQDAALNAVVLKLSDLYSRREILSFSAHESNPTFLLLNKEISQVTNQLRENLHNLIDNARLAIANLQERRDVIAGQLNRLPVKEQKLIDIRRQYELTSEIYTFLLQKRAELEIMLASTISNIQIMDPASAERVMKSGIPPNILYVLALLLGAGLPAFVVMMISKLNNTIELQEDVQRLTALTVIGNIPHGNGKNEMVVVKDPRAAITESFRTVRTNLKYMLSQGDQKVIGIHSVRPGEGKTFNSLNLACILALNDRKVLLVGADMRRPHLHKPLNMKSVWGLSTYLIGQSTYEEIVLETSINNLSFVASGPIPPNPAELLERPAFSELIARAREEFDYVIIDNAPISLVTDGLITCRASDLNIVILRYGVSRKDQISFINELSDRGLMKHLSLVINDIKASRFGYGYNYSYKYNDKKTADYFGKRKDVPVQHQPRVNGTKVNLNKVPVSS
ncbi:MAG: polysaccharide biosynthesis tyrosine autokinase [Prolixibacteraceae bacterium]